MRALTFLTLLTLLFCPILSGCAGSRLGTGSAGFCKAESAHFVLYVDESCQRASARVVDLENWLSALSKLGWGGFGWGTSAPLRLNVGMLSHERDYERYGSSGTGGFFDEDVLMEPWVVMPASPIYQADTLKHELVHYIAFQSIPQQPEWFAEGVATYFTTASFDSEGRFGIGIPHRKIFNAIFDWGILDANDILHPSRPVRHSTRFYASSWLLVHYLMSERPADFEEYQVRLARGVPFDQAFADSFHDLKPDIINATLHSYLFKGSFARFRHPIEQVRRVPVQAHVLSRAEEHALQGTLWLSGCRDCTAEEQRKRADRAFAAALDLDPSQLQASVRKLAYYAKHVSPSALAEARALALRHPDEWTAWATYAFVANTEKRLDDGLTNPDPIAELDRLVPRHPYTWILKAHREANSHIKPRAVRSAQYAIRLSPQSLTVLNHAIDVYAKVNACQELTGTIASLRQLEYFRLNEQEETNLKGMVDKCRVSTAADQTLVAP